MPTTLLLEGDDLEALLLRARQEAGTGARIVRAEKVRDGGFMGFFAKEHFEVAVEVPDDGMPDQGVPDDGQPDDGQRDDGQPAAVPAGPSAGGQVDVRDPALAGAIADAVVSRGLAGQQAFARPSRVAAAYGAAPAPAAAAQDRPRMHEAALRSLAELDDATRRPAAGSGAEQAVVEALLATFAEDRAAAERPQAVPPAVPPVVPPVMPPVVAVLQATGTGDAHPIAAGAPPAGADEAPGFQPLDAGPFSGLSSLGEATRRTLHLVPAPSAGAAEAGGPGQGEVPGTPGLPEEAPLNPAARLAATRYGLPTGHAAGGTLPGTGDLPPAADDRPEFEALLERLRLHAGGALEGLLRTGEEAVPVQRVHPSHGPVARSMPEPAPVLPVVERPVVERPVVERPVVEQPVVQPVEEAGQVEAPEPAAEPEAADAPDAAAARQVLRAAGVPSSWVRRYSGGDRFTAVLAMLSRMPVLDIDPDTPVVAVVGPARAVTLEAHRVAVDLAAGDGPRTVVAVPTQPGSSRRAAVAAARRTPTPVVVAVQTEGYLDADTVLDTLQATGAGAVLVVVDGHAPIEDTQEWVDALDRVDGVVVDGADARRPAAVLSLELPVVRMDGIPLDAVTWTALLCAQLEVAARTADAERDAR